MRVVPSLRGGRRALAALVATAVLVAGACSSEGAADDDGPTATVGDRSERTEVTAADAEPFNVRETAVAGPGTPLGAGLDVPEGAILLGTPFPDLEGGGFRALLLVPGDPAEVFHALRDQASTMGLQGAAGCLTAGDRMGCSAHLVDAADGETLTLSLMRRVTDLSSVSGLGLRYRPPGTVEDGQPSDEATVPAAPPAVLPLPDVEVLEADPVDIGLLLRQADSRPITLEPGGDLAGPPGPCACDGEGWSFVVEIDGVIRDVIAAYGRQLSDLGEVPDIEDGRSDDLTVLSLPIGQGDRRAEIMGVETDRGPDYVMVTVVGA